MSLGIIYRVKVATVVWFISSKSLNQMEIVDTCAIALHCTMSRQCQDNVKTMSRQCQDNVSIVRNNILLHKILINKSIIKITYVTTSMPLLPDIV